MLITMVKRNRRLLARTILISLAYLSMTGCQVIQIFDHPIPVMAFQDSSDILTDERMVADQNSLRAANSK